ncbi:hypothetical protein FEDK69T_02950 [Flavobacterium enshiense DK69]|uniref:DUF5723 domain-containing protein n=1 Tax=Flavobacterium enshiense DK69 TaxID=1107311 RepID=V6SDJ6_9FLAO|nr:hypothetical protein [Flavobacterium enshiense]ESU24743.1 hypothetical protein FEDK69T_02950 [Flavobacterium enshiense DK69]KGO96801.1 hypothetical protein Q767_03595 [Flavobacterium enshiense DK69]
MKKILLLASSLLSITAFSQEHFSGINISKRTGLLNAYINPSELNNMVTKFDVNVINMSTNVSNNKIKFSDIVNGENIEDKIFTGTEPVNMRLDALILGPSFGMKVKKWAFAISSAANIKANAIDVDVTLGNALNSSFLGTAEINSSYNQRMNGATWGEINLSAARTLYENDKHKFNAGATFKLLFPGSYSNFGLNNLQGTVTVEPVTGDVYLYNATATMNFSYSGALADSYKTSSNYDEIFAGGLNGYGADFGFNYQLKEKASAAADGTTPKTGGYKLNTGLSFRNMGSMTFKSDNNKSANYVLNIPTANPLNLEEFNDAQSVADIEQILKDNGYLTQQNSGTDFKVNLPAVINAYVDYKIYNKWSVSAYTQQKLSDDTQDDIMTIQNIITLTPRFSSENYEIYMPFSDNEVSGFTTGFGIRAGGFFLGSGSVITALLNNSKQADLYLGFRIGF